MKIVFIGLTISSTWGNGHATTYRALLKGLSRKGADVHFLERIKPWYANNVDFSGNGDYKISFYDSVSELEQNYGAEIENANMVVVGSYTPDCPEVSRLVFAKAKGVKAFYDIDTPVTLDKLKNRDYEYLRPEMIPEFDLYLSFAGGRTLEILEEKYGSPAARALYCSVDPELYFPVEMKKIWHLGYLGTYSPDRQPALEQLLLEPAAVVTNKKFVVAGPGYPDSVAWPANVQRIDHLGSDQHLSFYNRQHLTLNITRKAMKELGHSPSVRLFEAAACGVPVISDYWDGLDELFEFGKEIFVADDAAEVIDLLKTATPETCLQMGEAARKRILANHTATHRAEELLAYFNEVSQSEKATSDVGKQLI